MRRLKIRLKYNTVLVRTAHQGGVSIMTTSRLATTTITRHLVALGLLLALVACGRAPDLIGIDNPDVPVASVQGATRHKIFIATTRQQTEARGALFSAERAPDLGLASVDVSIPPTHVVGELERPKRMPPDPRTEFAIVDPTIYGSDTAFLNALNRELAKRPGSSRDILLFVHGYNNTTSDALLRLAQFTEDTGFEGVPVLLDWASAASLTRYVYDLNSALVARQQVPKLSAILRRSNATKVDLFAHSMGGLSDHGGDEGCSPRGPAEQNRPDRLDHSRVAGHRYGSFPRAT